MILHVTRGEEDYKVRMLKSAAGAAEQQLEDVKKALERAQSKAEEGATLPDAEGATDADDGTRKIFSNPLDQENAVVTDNE